MAQSARQERLTAADARWLVTEGASHVTDTLSGLDGGSTQLAVAQALRDRGMAASRVAAVVGAAQSRQRARARWRISDRLWFTPTALEQASDPAVAAWRAARYDDVGVVVDAGCGAGADLLALAGRAATVVGVDRDVARLHLARANLDATGRVAHLVAGDATTWPVRAEALHADPSRRVDGRRVRALADTLPAVDVLCDGPIAAGGIVVSPAVSLTDPALPDDVEVEFVQVGPRLVEAVLWLGDLRRPGVVATATILADDGPVDVGQAHPVATVHRTSGTVADDGVSAGVGGVGNVLLEPAPALVRARLHERMAAEHDGRRLSPHAALLTVDQPVPPSPWWHAWQVEAVLPGRPKAVRRWLAGTEPIPMEIALHGPGLQLDAWWAGLRRIERGPQGRRLHVVRLADGVVAIPCTPLPAGATQS